MMRLTGAVIVKLKCDLPLITMKDIAEKAGVSTATVSRVLAKTGKVAVTTRRRVEQISSEMGYHLNSVSRPVISGRPLTILALVPDLSDCYYSKLIEGVAAACEKLGHLILYLNMLPHKLQNLGQITTNLTIQPDGILMMGETDISTIEGYTRKALPTVLVNDCSAGLTYPAVGIDNLTAAFEAVRYLMSLGHRRIACVTGPDSITLYQYRRQGYIQALCRGNIPLEPRYFFRGDLTARSGAEALSYLMHLPNPPQAIFCHNDRMAIGLLKQAKQIGINVPEQLSVIGFDDIDEALHSNPPLTTVSQPRYELGIESITLLSNIITGASPIPGSRILETHLVCRDSTSLAPR